MLIFHNEDSVLSDCIFLIQVKLFSFNDAQQRQSYASTKTDIKLNLK